MSKATSSASGTSQSLGLDTTDSSFTQRAPISKIELVTLNPDILGAVLEFVAGEDDYMPTIAAITRTCKRMRLEGTKYLLSSTVPKLQLIEDICSFCHFMLAEPARLPLLKSLVLSCDSIEADDHVRLVCEMLRGLSNLHKLDIAFDTASSPSARSAIAAAIASLTSLRVLKLNEFGRLTTGYGPDYPARAGALSSDHVFETALRDARAPLLSLSIGLPSAVDELAAGVRYSRRRDPIFLCSHLRHTLEHLEVLGGFSLIVRPGRTYEYPHLKKLTLPIYSICIPYMRPFVIAAPHLRELQIGGTDNSHTRHRHNEDILRGKIINRTQTPQEWRTTNEHDREVSNRSWPMLDSFKGAIIGAYSTGLTCPVARVHLLSTGGRRRTELAMLSIVLSDWRPSFLRLATKTYRARGYIPLLPSTSSGWAEALETLELRLNVVEDRFNLEECFVSDLRHSTFKQVR